MSDGYSKGYLWKSSSASQNHIKQVPQKPSLQARQTPHPRTTTANQSNTLWTLGEAPKPVQPAGIETAPDGIKILYDCYCHNLWRIVDAIIDHELSRLPQAYRQASSRLSRQEQRQLRSATVWLCIEWTELTVDLAWQTEPTDDATAIQTKRKAIVSAQSQLEQLRLRLAAAKR